MTKPATPSKIVVIGGSGFVGTQIVHALARTGSRIHVIVRDAESAAHLKPYGDVGQITISSGNALHIDSITPYLSGATSVIYLPGLLFESGTQRFAQLHHHAPARIAKAAAEAGVKQFIFMSALGVERATRSQYATTKSDGERAVREAFPKAVIVRPSVVFGVGDNFINQFACMATTLPILPLIGGGNTKFQPVAVEDVAEAFVSIVTQAQTAGNTYELCGPETLTFKEILQFITRSAKRTPCLLSIPTPIAKVMGTFANIFMPTPVFTADQVTLLGYDNVASGTAKGFKQLGIAPRALTQDIDGLVARYRSDLTVATALAQRAA